MAKRKPVKTGKRIGQGPPPGLKWGIRILDVAYREGEDFLNLGQYRHLSMQVQDLAALEQPSASETIDVKLIGDSVYEVRDFGGILGGMNIRLFFGIDHSARQLVVLGVFQKQNNGPTPQGDLERNQHRWRRYKKGLYEDAAD